MRLFVALLSVATAALPIAAQKNPATAARRGMTFDDVMARKAVSDPQISPDGKWVVYVVTTADTTENVADGDLWIVGAGVGMPARLTTSKKADTQPRWSSDGKRIAFLSTRDGDKAQIFVIPPFGGEAEKLTDSKSAVRSFQWSPDGRRIAFVADQVPTPDEDKRTKDKDDALVIDQNFKFSRLWSIDVATKKATELVKLERVAGDPQWSPDGATIAFVSTPTPKADDGSMSDIWVVSATGGAPRRLTNNEGPDFAPRWSPDGRSLAFLTRDTTYGVLGQSRLASMPSTGGPARMLAARFEYQAGAPVWSLDGRTVFFSASVRTTTQLFAVPAVGGEARQLTKVRGSFAGATFSRDGAIAAFAGSDLKSPAEVFVAATASASAPVRRSDHNAELRDLAIADGEVIRWKSRDGMEIEGLLLYPIGYQRGKRYPTIALIHGGPAGVWTETFGAGWNNFGQVWAARGWAVFYPNVRGSSSYGEKFLLSNVKDWGRGDYNDIQSGLDTLIARGIADSTRLAQSGWSYGGYMTAWTVTQTSRFKAAMIGAGLTNMFSMYSTNDLQRVIEGYFGDQPWNDTEAYARASAMTFIKKARTPTLIQHGAADMRVPVSQAYEMYMGLRKNNVPAELVIYPREPHGLQEPRHQRDKMRREYAWMAKYVLGQDSTATTTSAQPLLP